MSMAAVETEGYMVKGQKQGIKLKMSQKDG